MKKITEFSADYYFRIVLGGDDVTSNIPHELAGLIHNVKLNEMNWLNKYIRNSILAFFLEFQDKRIKSI